MQVSAKKYFIILFSLLVLAVLVVGIVWFIANNSAQKLDVLNEISSFELEEVQTESTYQSDNNKIKLLAFIFINCPDGVCPMTMQDFSQIQDKLKEKKVFGKDVELLAITFDPIRDTTEALQEYAQIFQADPEGWRFLRGSEEATQEISDDLKFFYAFQEDGSGMHATTMYLLDEKHQVRQLYRMSSANSSMDQDQILKDINQLIKEKGR